jgi:2-amino-4-hydroxy-6-hydroxymethyldihydropteridine diphosphokinase
VTAAYVAAGSNVEPMANLRRALDLLAAHFGPLELSRAYRNPAVGFKGDDFVNLVLGFDTARPVRDVVALLHEAEAACGRERNAPKFAPRAMDLDILLFGAMVCDEPGLTLPRPDLVRRPYMLGPMAELAPGLQHPTLGRTMQELWQGCDHAAHAMQPVDLGWTNPRERNR